MRLILTAIVLVLPVSCGVSEGNRSDTGTAATWNNRPDTAFAGVAELTDLHGKTESEVVVVMGQPDFRQDITLHAGETLSEFMIEVHNTYPPDDPSIEGTVIRHLQWERNGYSEAVFLHQPDQDTVWVVLESLKWSNNVEF